MVVLSDNYLAGKQSGEATVEFLKAKYGAPKGKVLEITGNLAQNVAQLRGGGFNDVMKQYPGHPGHHQGRRLGFGQGRRHRA